MDKEYLDISQTFEMRASELVKSKARDKCRLFLDSKFKLLSNNTD